MMMYTILYQYILAFFNITIHIYTIIAYQYHIIIYYTTYRKNSVMDFPSLSPLISLRSETCLSKARIFIIIYSLYELQRATVLNNPILTWILNMFNWSFINAIFTILSSLPTNKLKRIIISTMILVHVFVCPSCLYSDILEILSLLFRSDNFVIRLVELRLQLDIVPFPVD